MLCVLNDQCQNSLQYEQETAFSPEVSEKKLGHCILWKQWFGLAKICMHPFSPVGVCFVYEIPNGKNALETAFVRK